MGKKKWIFLYIALNLLIITLIGIIDPEIKDLGKVFSDVKLGWITGGILSMFLFSVMDGTILGYGINIIHKPATFWRCLKVSFIGQYYNAVTPFASGGQPAQVYYMRKMGIPGGSASSVLMIKFLVYQVVLSLYSVAAFAWKGIPVYRYNSWIFWFSVLGFIINAGAVFLLVLLSFNKNFVKNLVFKIVGFLGKIRVIKDPIEIKNKLLSHVEDFHSGLKLMQGNLRAILIMGIMTALQLFFFFSITFFIHRSLGLKGERWINIIFVQSLLYLAVSFVPTPGSTGASETGFMIFFRIFFPSNLIFISMLLWRIISYYMNIFVGILIVLFDSIRQIASHDVTS